MKTTTTTNTGPRVDVYARVTAKIIADKARRPDLATALECRTCRRPHHPAAARHAAEIRTRVAIGSPLPIPWVTNFDR